MTLAQQYGFGRFLLPGLILAVVIVGTNRAQAEQAPETEVIVLSTLHQFHGETRCYSFGDLSSVIEQLDPGVLAVELTPADLESRRNQSTKQEYQQSVFPLLDKNGYAVVPMEPAQPLFDEIVGLFRKAQTDLNEQNPDMAKAFGLYADSLYELLRNHWISIEAVNSRETDILFESKHRFQNAIFGPMEADAWERWNRHFLKQILYAAETNPGSRIVVLVGAEHAYWLRAHLKSGDLHLLDVEQMLAGSESCEQ